MQKPGTHALARTRTNTLILCMSENKQAHKIVLPNLPYFTKFGKHAGKG